ncbi:MAG: hypothetical protein WBQ25_06990 [Nitrososphaeraceae archaeon]
MIGSGLSLSLEEHNVQFASTAGRYMQNLEADQDECEYKIKIISSIDCKSYIHNGLYFGEDGK